MALTQCLRRWPYIKQTLGERPVFDGYHNPVAQFEPASH